MVLFKSEDEPRLAAYFLDQAKLMRDEIAPPRRPEDCRIALGELEKLTQLQFGPSDHEAAQRT